MSNLPLPEQFEINEAWVAFKLNTSPIFTKEDGEFNCFSLMDAASGFILSTSFVSVLATSLPAEDVIKMMEEAHAHKHEWPKLLLCQSGQAVDAMIEKAERLGISVRVVPESQLDVFVSDAKEGFNERFGSGDLH
ncbi:hypothetical protein [Viridibacterium curvum]